MAIGSGLNQVAINVNQNGTVTFYVERYPVVVLLNDSDHGSCGLLKNVVSIGILIFSSLTNIVYTVGGYGQLNSVAVVTGSGVDGSSPGSGALSPVPVNLGYNIINGNNNGSVGVVAGVVDGSYVLIEGYVSLTNEVHGSRSNTALNGNLASGDVIIVGNCTVSNRATGILTASGSSPNLDLTTGEVSGEDENHVKHVLIVTSFPLDSAIAYPCAINLIVTILL